MGRKRKQIDLKGEFKTSLPPCRVCDAPGAGFHYGANTCEACKGFFHRSLKICQHYKCEGNGNCVIEHGRSRLCQFCRYNKCLTVGMAKEAIKTGRYTSVKRTNDILEIKRLQANKIPHQIASGSNITFQKLPLEDRDIEGDSFLGSDSKPAQNSFLFGQISSVNMAQSKSEPSEALSLKDSDFVTEVNQKPCISLFGQKLSVLDNHISRTCAVIDCFVKRKLSPGMSTLQEIESLFSESPDDHNCIQTIQLQHCDPQHPSSVSPLSVTSPYGSPPEGSITRPSPSMLTDAATSLLSLSSSAVYSSGPSSISTASTIQHSPSSLISLNSPSASVISVGTMTLSPAPSLTNAASSTPSNIDVQMYISDSPNSTSDVGCEKSIIDLYQDKDSIVRILVESNENYMVPLTGRLSQEEIQQQQKEHFVQFEWGSIIETPHQNSLAIIVQVLEHSNFRLFEVPLYFLIANHFYSVNETCKLQQEMFGQLRRLPDHEYDYIFATTGLDMDDRQKRLVTMEVGLEKVIRAMVKFCKMIPGFSRLDISDKVKLIKYSRQEFCMFSMYKNMNAEKRIIRGLDGLWKCENEITRMSTDSDSKIAMENIDLHFKFYSSLQNLKLSDEELVVIKALIVMSPDRNPYVDSTLARDIHWQLNECLIHVLSKRYPNPLIVYARIMAKLTEARSQTEGMIRFFKQLKIDKYSNVLNNPLLREMCSGIFFDDKEEDGAHTES